MTASFVATILSKRNPSQAAAAAAATHLITTPLPTTTPSRRTTAAAAAAAPLPPPPPPNALQSRAILEESFRLNLLRRRDWSLLDRHLPSSLRLAGPSLLRRILHRPSSSSSPRLALDFLLWAADRRRQVDDLETLSSVVHALVSERMFDEALSVVRDLLQRSAVPLLRLLDAFLRHGHSSVAVFDAFVRACTQIGRTEDALLVILMLRERGVRVSVHAWNNLLNAVLVSGRAGEGVAAFWKLYKEMWALGYAENVNTFNLVIYALCRECRVWDAFSVFYGMLKRGVFPNTVTVNMLVDGCCRNGEVEIASKLVEKIKVVCVTLEPNCITFNSLINGLCKVGKTELGEQVMINDMMDEGILPNVTTYGTLIDGYAREGKIEEALRSFNDMLDKGQVPNIVVYNSLVNWLFKSGYFEYAHLLLSNIRCGHVVPDCFTHSIVVDGFCKNGHFQEAIRYCKHINEEKEVEDAFPYNSLISYLCKFGRIDEARQFLGRMFASGLTPDVVTYSTLIDGYFKDQRVDDALQTYNKMVEEGIIPNLITYNSVVNGFCKTEHVDTARLVMEELRRRGFLLDITTYNILIYGYLSRLRVYEAITLCHDMKRSYIVFNKVTYNTILSFLCNNQCFDNAKYILRVMFDKDIAADQITYTILIVSFSRHCNADEVVKLHDYLVIRGVPVNEHIYNSFVRLLVE